MLIKIENNARLKSKFEGNILLSKKLPKYANKRPIKPARRQIVTASIRN